MDKQAKIYTLLSFVVLLVVEIFGRSFDLYFFVPWLGMLAHAIAGVFLAFLTIYFLISIGAFNLGRYGFFLTQIVVLVSALIFEVGQFLFNLFRPYKVNDFSDTFLDIIFVLLGGIFAYSLFYFLEKDDDK